MFIDDEPATKMVDKIISDYNLTDTLKFLN